MYLLMFASERFNKHENVRVRALHWVAMLTRCVSTNVFAWWLRAARDQPACTRHHVSPSPSPGFIFLVHLKSLPPQTSRLEGARPI